MPGCRLLRWWPGGPADSNGRQVNGSSIDDDPATRGPAAHHARPGLAASRPSIARMDAIAVAARSPRPRTFLLSQPRVSNPRAMSASHRPPRTPRRRASVSADTSRSFTLRPPSIRSDFCRHAATFIGPQDVRRSPSPRCGLFRRSAPTQDRRGTSGFRSGPTRSIHRRHTAGLPATSGSFTEHGRFPPRVGRFPLLRGQRSHLHHLEVAAAHPRQGGQLVVAPARVRGAAHVPPAPVVGQQHPVGLHGLHDGLHAGGQ
ncbi:MAG: hypothetical protein JWM27_2245 [Gemmatimonadetes bacterium]|nr:hypothetical protein [Gemmatimonadota bacterium]